METEVSTILYLGLDCPDDLRYTHFPLIRIVPRPFQDLNIANFFSQFTKFTHLIFTSKTAVNLFFQLLPIYKINLSDLERKRIIAVGKGTAKQIKKYNIENQILTAHEETAEGVVSMMTEENSVTTHSFIGWPHSGLARSIIIDFCKANDIRYNSCVFYDIVKRGERGFEDSFQLKAKLKQLVDDAEEMIFTSPSIVEAFFQILGKFPENKKLTCIGPITQATLLSLK